MAKFNIELDSDVLNELLNGLCDLCAGHTNAEVALAFAKYMQQAEVEEEEAGDA